jgi:Conjugative transposon protein TcpC
MQVRQKVVDNGRSHNRAVRSALRGVGRVAMWTVLAILLLRGLGAVLAPPVSNPSPLPSREAALADASSAFAVRFARTYLNDPSPQALSPFLAEGVHLGAGRPPAPGAGVAQAEVSATQELGGGRAVLTVACELRDARTLYLAVPISRSRAGEVAALGAPSIVAAPGVAGAASERSQPLVGPEAPAIQALVEKFLPAYVSARASSDLSYLSAPEAAIAPLGGTLELLGAPGSVSQVGDGEGRRRTVVVASRLRDPFSGATYRLDYRLVLLRHGRWYVEAVEGALP